MLILYASVYLEFNAFYFTFMGLVSWVDSIMVASSSSVGGSGKLQCGIRAHIAAWALMGHEEAVTKAGYPRPSRGKMCVKDRKISEKFF